ncbi:MAG TPA: transketolase [Bdellovibrionota bacterium]|jgi:transketolase|nr:transketolase [Bdellovibrionota bacterium]
MSFSWTKAELSSEETRLAMRKVILQSIHAAKSGHPGGSLSMVEILTSIFENFEWSAKDAKRIDRDRFVLSKGHGVPAYYAVLARLGFFETQEMLKLRTLGHFLQGHPDHRRFELMEASTGSLGQGLSFSLGLAMGLELQAKQEKWKRVPRVYCVMGDGEMQEGQVWEALMAAPKFAPKNLCVVLDYNKGQIDGPVAEIMNLEPIVDKVRAFNWDVVEGDGHDVNFVKSAIAPTATGAASWSKPRFVVAHTVKGKGVSFMEDPTKWHGAAPSDAQLEQALVELEAYGKTRNVKDCGRL